LPPTKDLKRSLSGKLFASYKGSETFTKWLTQQEWHEAEGEYSRLFEIVYDQPSQRRAYIERAVRKAKPGWGYAYLSSLLQAGAFNVVFTTNFDDLLAEACYSFTIGLRPMVCAHDSAVSSVRLMSDRPKIIKLHGDFLYDSIKNTSSELQSLESNMRDKFIEFAKEYGLVVVGYGGGDQSVMDMLDVLVRSDSYFRNGIYWCIRQGTCPGRRLRQLLRNDRVFWIEIAGFDELMADISTEISCDLPEAILAPHSSALQRSKHLLDTPKTSHPILNEALSNTREVYQRIQRALEDVGLEGWQLEKNADPMSELTDLLPLLQGMHMAADDKNWKEACQKLRPIAEKDKTQVGRNAWGLLMRCLVRHNAGHKEAKDLLGQAPPTAWQDSTHYIRRAYYALYLCQAKDSLSFADRALELNANLVSARVNRMLALHYLGDTAERNKELKALSKSSVKEHHRAAAKAVVGDLDEAVRLLQHAVVLGRYTVNDACRDVAFRTLWRLPEFEAGLKAVGHDTTLVYPYFAACPPSEAERKVREKLIGKKTPQKKSTAKTRTKASTVSRKAHDRASRSR
jgi:tetratricopeptide (TPR) repeat protein